LIAQSTKTAFVLDNVRLLEKLILMQAFILNLVNNFVSFPDLYDTHERAMFERGTLVMDGRRFNLAVTVDDRKQHAQVAQTSNMFVVYVEVAPKDNAPKYEVALPVTSGGKGNLCLGKRGVFYDLNDNECDARVVHIIENPISYREALSAPFKRVGRLLTGKIESLTTQAEKKLDSEVASTFTEVTTTGTPAPQTPAQPSGTAAGSLLMGGSVAVAALGSAAAYITKTIADVNPITMVLGVLGAVVLVMVPISVVAFFKLRRRDLSAILEGSGWGINARMRLTRAQCHFFTKRPGYPLTARGIRRIAWSWLLVGAVLILGILGSIYFFYMRSCGCAPDCTPTPNSVIVPEKYGP
jgi:hypothetical protein